MSPPHCFLRIWGECLSRGALLQSRTSLRILVVISLFVLIGCDNYQTKIEISPYPPGYDFALTITDDPDDGWFEQKKIIYDFLDGLGMKTSVGVWVFDNKHGSGNLPYYHQGISLEDPAFLSYVSLLKAKGFELFLHTVSGGNDLRVDTLAGFERYLQYFGEYPHHCVNHFTNYDNIYWGYKRFDTLIMQKLYGLFQGTTSLGDDHTSLYFWGDYCKQYIQYVRSWATADINTLKFNPSMPYHESSRPYVNYWYACSDGANVDKFNTLISRGNVQRLIDERGTAIIYTHFSSGFVDRETGIMNEETKQLLSWLASHKNGWFVPVRTILERFQAIKKIEIHETQNSYLVLNTGNMPVNGIVLKLPDNELIVYENKTYKSTNSKPTMVTIGSVHPQSFVQLQKVIEDKEVRLAFWERFRLQMYWLLSRF